MAFAAALPVVLEIQQERENPRRPRSSLETDGDVLSGESTEMRTACSVGFALCRRRVHRVVLS